MTTSRMGYLLPILLTCVGASVAASFDIKYEWKYVDYKWKNAAQKAKAIASGTYNASRTIILDAQPLSDGRVIVTLPKGLNSNPASIATVSDERGPGGPLLVPYPDWSYHTAKNCSGITQIRRAVVDSYNRLWAVDTGTVGRTRVCTAKILVFDLSKNTILQTVEIPDEVARADNLQIYAVEAKRRSLKSVTVYISDFSSPALLIWNGSKVWRVDNAVFENDPEQTTLSVGGYDLDLSTVGGGPSSIEIPPSGIFTSDLVFFRPLASVKLYFASRSQLLASETGSVDYYVSDYTMPHQELNGVVSSDGIRFGSASTEMTVTCWNMLNPLTSEYVNYFETDEENLQYVSALKIFKRSSDCEELWVTSDRLTKYFDGALDLNDYNYRIMAANVKDLVTGTVCDPARATRSRSTEDCPASVQQDATSADFSVVCGSS